MIRVVLIGAESTGKSTLAQALQERLGVPCTHEFVRTYVENLGRELTIDDLDPIAQGQLEVEDRVRDAPLVLHDTNLLSTLIYADHYFGVRQPWVEAAFAHRDYALYLFCQPDIPWVPDVGQREGPQARATLHARFARELEARRLPFVRMTGPPEHRADASVRAIEAL